jgi:predicted RecA/RadA family phage recombinase
MKMKNYVQDGEKVTLSAPYDVLSGAGAQVGSLFGVALIDALSGAQVTLQLTGVVEIAKTSAQAWTVGAKIYWDNTTKLATTTASTNVQIGVATVAAANPSSTGIVRLSAGFTI